MKKLWLALFLAILGLAPAQAQTTFTMPPPAGVVVGGVQVVTTCGGATLSNGQLAVMAMDLTGKLCTNASGGGGGGLSVVDQTTWVQGTSAFTPTGCVFNDTATLASGQEGTLRCTTDRQAKVLDSTVLAAIQAPVPACNTTPCNIIGIVQTTTIPNVTPTACGGTVVTGGTAVNAFTALSTRHGFTIANIDTAEVAWISFTGTALANDVGSYPLAPATATTFAGLSSYTSPPGFGMNTALSIVAATNGHKFSCTWW